MDVREETNENFALEYIKAYAEKQYESGHTGKHVYAGVCAAISTIQSALEANSWLPIDEMPEVEVTHDLCYCDGNTVYICVNTKTQCFTMGNFLIHSVEWEDDTEYADKEGNWYFKDSLINPDVYMKLTLPTPPQEKE